MVLMNLVQQQPVEETHSPTTMTTNHPTNDRDNAKRDTNSMANDTFLQYIHSIQDKETEFFDAQEEYQREEEEQQQQALLRQQQQQQANAIQEVTNYANNDNYYDINTNNQYIDINATANPTTNSINEPNIVSNCPSTPTAADATNTPTYTYDMNTPHDDTSVPSRGGRSSVAIIEYGKPINITSSFSSYKNNCFCCLFPWFFPTQRNDEDELQYYNYNNSNQQDLWKYNNRGSIGSLTTVATIGTGGANSHGLGKKRGSKGSLASLGSFGSFGSFGIFNDDNHNNDIVIDDSTDADTIIPHVRFELMTHVFEYEACTDVAKVDEIWWTKEDFRVFLRNNILITRDNLDSKYIDVLRKTSFQDDNNNNNDTNKEEQSQQQQQKKQQEENCNGTNVTTTNKDNWWHEYGHSRRGLEKLLPNSTEGKERQDNVFSVVEAVLQEQEKQTRLFSLKRHKLDDEKIRAVSLKFTAWAKVLARAAGASDADAVKNEFNQSRKTREWFVLQNLMEQVSTVNNTNNTNNATSCLTTSKRHLVNNNNQKNVLNYQDIAKHGPEFLQNGLKSVYRKQQQQTTSTTTATTTTTTPTIKEEKTDTEKEASKSLQSISSSAIEKENTDKNTTTEKDKPSVSFLDMKDIFANTGDDDKETFKFTKIKKHHRTTTWDPSITRKTTTAQEQQQEMQQRPGKTNNKNTTNHIVHSDTNFNKYTDNNRRRASLMVFPTLVPLRDESDTTNTKHAESEHNIYTDNENDTSKNNMAKRAAGYGIDIQDLKDFKEELKSVSLAAIRDAQDTAGKKSTPSQQQQQ